MRNKDGRGPVEQDAAHAATTAKGDGSVPNRRAYRIIFPAILIVVGGVLVLALLARLYSVLGPSRAPEEARDSKPPAQRSVGESVPVERPAKPGEAEGPATSPNPPKPPQPVPEGVIAGRVVDERGDPIAEAEIAVLMSRHVQARDEAGALRPLTREDLFEASAKTDAAGEFEVSGLLDRKTVPMAKAGDEIESVTCILVAQKVGYRTTWLDVRPGQYELRVVLEETVALVSGKVVDARSGEPVEGARIECRTSTATSGADGAFSIKVPVEVDPPERIKVSVLCYPKEPTYARQERRDVELVQGQQVEGLLFELERGTASIEGVVLKSGSREPAPGMRVRLYELNPERPYYFPDETHPELSADAADGTFVFDGLRLGTFQIEAVKPEWNCVLGRAQVTVSDSPAPGPITIYLSGNDANTVTGTVTGPDGKPVEGAVVWLLQSDRLVYMPTATDAEGRYGLQSYVALSQGQLSVLVFHPDYELKIAPLAAGEARPVQLDVVLGWAAHLGGVVRDEEGRPMAGATVVVEGPALGPPLWAYYTYLPNPRAPFTTKDDGEYAFTYLPPGTYEVTATLTGYVIAKQKVQMVSGADQRCDFAMDRGAEISGTVYDEQGEALRVRSVVAVGRDGTEYDSAVSGADGRFTLRTLPRDEPVNILVLADVVDLRSDKPFYHAKLEQVQPGRDDVRLDAEAIRRGAVEIEVVEAGTGDPVARYEVWCSLQPRPGLDGLAQRFVASPAYGRASVADEKGRTTLDRLLPGEHKFTVTANGFMGAMTETVAVTGGGTTHLRVELHRVPAN
jgi:protocatechuate 3,4-dioxygenase beta subunit